ncbi:hypothetical protein D3C86_1867940 [compost metagenome]
MRAIRICLKDRADSKATFRSRMPCRMLSSRITGRRLFMLARMCSRTRAVSPVPSSACNSLSSEQSHSISVSAWISRNSSSLVLK